MISFPNCKINLGLDVTGKRPDGFHNLETIFYPLPVYDVLEIITASDNNNEVSFTASGMHIDGDWENNLCVKAYRLLKKDFSDLAPIQMHLHKIIPIGAGLGGGSADGAFALKMLNQIFNLQLTGGQLVHYAATLGSDCPFFTSNNPCFATGRGEIMEPVQPVLAGYQLILINPGIHINTAHAFSRITPMQPSHSVKEIIQLPVIEWKGKLKNDFEMPVFNQYPEIASLRDQLYNTGALYASMSGSGSSVYGIFEKGKKIAHSFPERYFSKEISL